MSDLAVESLSEREGIRRLEPVWNELLAESGTDTIFLSFEWITTWLDWIGRDVEPRVLVARDRQSDVVGIAPLMINARRVEFIGAPNSDYSDFIVQDDREPVIRAFFDHLLHKPRHWDSIALREIPDGSPTVAALRRVIGSPFLPALVNSGTMCPTLLIAGHEDEILKELARKKYIGKRDLAKSIAHIETIGPLKFRQCATLDEAREVLPALFRMHRERWAESDPSKFEDDAYESFYYELLERLFPAGYVAVTVMELDSRPIAVSFAFPRNDVWTNHTWAYDRAYSKLSAGSLLIQFMIADAVERGYKEFDFTRGAEPYKDRFANHTKRNVDVVYYDDLRAYTREWTAQMLMRGRERYVVANPRLHDALRRARNKVRPATTP
jgi:CelD/BcsL family acetyltransferase involved in cellulose biosynthesis